MGGIGSGRHRYAKTFTTDELPALKVSLWRGHELRGSRSTHQVNWKKHEKLAAKAFVTTGIGLFAVRWRYSNVDRAQSVRLSWAGCNYGGSRAWFLCPQVQCRQRVTTLYIGPTLACRHCLKLRYASTTESIQDRAIRRVRRTRRQLVCSTNLFKPTNGRPKGMRHNTYQNLLYQHEEGMRILTLTLRNQNNSLRRKVLKPDGKRGRTQGESVLPID